MQFPKPWFRNKPIAVPELHLPFRGVPQLRTALLGEPGCFANVVYFEASRWGELSAYRPEILLGRAPDLLRYAEHVFSGAYNSSSLDSAIILTPVGEAPISDAHRDFIWRALRVPTYEVLVDFESGILASECQAHEGWHVRDRRLRFELQTGAILLQKNGISASTLPTGLVADGLDGMCPCGDEAPLLRKVRIPQPVAVKRLRAKATRRSRAGDKRSRTFHPSRNATL